MTPTDTWIIQLREIEALIERFSGSQRSRELFTGCLARVRELEAGAATSRQEGANAEDAIWNPAVGKADAIWEQENQRLSVAVRILREALSQALDSLQFYHDEPIEDFQKSIAVGVSALELTKELA